MKWRCLLFLYIFMTVGSSSTGNEFSKEIMRNDPHHNIHVITGKVQGGKTTFLTEIIERLTREEVKITGFLCPGSFHKGERSGFTLVNPEDGRQIQLATIQEKKEWLRFSRFYFNPDAFVQGETWIRHGLTQHPDLVVIDEVGPMELQELGWNNVLRIIEKRHDIAQIWVVREQILQDVKQRWNIHPDNIFGIDRTERTVLFNNLYKKLKETIFNN